MFFDLSAYQYTLINCYQFSILLHMLYKNVGPLLLIHYINFYSDIIKVLRR